MSTFKSVVVFLLLCLAISTQAITLAENGVAKATIVHNGFLQPAKNLQSYLKQISGAELPMVISMTDDLRDKPVIVIEKVDQLLGASNDTKGKQAYRIKTDGDKLTLSAITDLGIQYAVWGLLEDHLGCRFYNFKAKGLSYGGPGHEVIPKKSTLTINKIDDFQQPAFAQRGFIFWMGSYPWIMQNRGVGYPANTVSGDLAAGHNFYELLPPQDKKDAKGNITEKGLFAEHPDFYPLNKAGQRETPWSMGVCGTNPDLPKFLAEALRSQIAKRKKQMGAKYDPALPISAAQGDGFTGCMCDNCRKLVHDEQSEAAPLILMLNRALEDLEKTDPDQQVITFAYFDSLDAPKTIKPHKNLWINVVSSARSQNSAGDQVGPITNNPANRDYAKALKEWPKIAPGRVTTWHWVPFQPEWPAIFYLSDIMKYWKECGIYGTNPQLCSDNWQWLYSWVYLKLAWNPELDADKLIRQFLDDNYGKAAAPYVWEYLTLARDAYADSGHVPSAVRWSGWTTTTRVKMFSPTILAKMTVAMDKALAAAEKEKDKRLLSNMIEARGSSLDAVTLNAAAYSGNPWGMVKYAADNKKWFVAGADPNVPGCLDRAKKAAFMNGGGEHGVLRTISWYVANNGGPVVELDGKSMSVAVCPDLKGQVTSAIDKKSGKELLAVQGGQAGYIDQFARISSQIWLPVDIAKNDLKHPNLADKDWSSVWSEFQNPNKDKLETDLTLSPSFYGFDTKNHLNRVVSTTDTGMQIDRKYNGSFAVSNRFSTRWMLALPNPKAAKVAVTGGGITKLLDLQYAVPGGIKGMKAGDRLPGLDAMDQKFDDVIAVSDAEPVNIPITANSTGDIVIQLDRGDGVAAVITTAANGWDAIELKPVVDKAYLQITLIATPAAKDATAINLPVQVLSSKTVPVVKQITTATVETTAVLVAPKIKITGATTAINELDGAELIWIPAGDFLRGSPKGKGAGDERPQRKIYLDGYWMYKYPVTVAQYKKYCDATVKTFSPTWGQGMYADPKGDEGAYAVQMSWYEADTYAKAIGAALPTEAQWEKAARGTDGREYPWGNKWDSTKCVSMEETLYKFSSGFKPVGSYPQGASPYGVMDMAGNVWEWVADWYSYEYYKSSPAKNPTGPATGSHKVLRGGCSLYDERLSRTAARFINPPHVRDWTPTGFRCVVNAPGPK
jgi:sulfatase modifying factor 1